MNFYSLLLINIEVDETVKVVKVVHRKIENIPQLCISISSVGPNWDTGGTGIARIWVLIRLRYYLDK